VGVAPNVAALLDAIAQRFAVSGPLEDKLLDVTQAACENLSGVDYASISILHADGSLDTAAATASVIIEADRWQYELREGPCYAAVTTDDALVSDDVGHDARWPQYGPRARRLGLRAQTALPLYRHEGDHGALNLYSSTADAFRDPDHLIGLFTTQATIALGHAGEVHNLRRANYTRKVIGQALGIIMERYQINEDRAFEYLIRTSQTGNIKLRDVADEVVRVANRAPHG
jgi:GAF domain-containing protein